ncbi:MAG: hypothetical protein KC503_12025 [Myxococcales bacterium]|nr:hypothetical protein [Myxococcales bacterium]
MSKVFLHESLAFDAMIKALAPTAMALAALFCGCSPKIKGGPVVNARPTLRLAKIPNASFRVWVIVRTVKVNAYPYPRLSRQPMVQFSGDLARFKRGWGRMARLVSPTRIKAGDTADVFAGAVLWTQTLRVADKRRFKLWLRQNQHSAPTPGQRKLRPVLDIAHAVEGVSAALGTKIPAHQALTISVSVLKALAVDPLILEWECPWSHIMTRVNDELAKGKHPDGVVELDTEIVAKEQKKGRPTSRLALRFIVQRLSTSAAAQ